MLCSTYTTTHLAERVLLLLEDHLELTNYQSLYILCMSHVNMDGAISFVIEKFPHILAKFGTAALKDDYNEVGLARVSFVPQKW